MPPVAIYDEVVISYEVKKPLIKVEGVPPEEMRLDRYARSFADSRIVGHERVSRSMTDRDGLRARRSPQYVQSQSTPEFTQEATLQAPAGRWRRALATA